MAEPGASEGVAPLGRGQNGVGEVRQLVDSRVQAGIALEPAQGVGEPRRRRSLRGKLQRFDAGLLPAPLHPETARALASGFGPESWEGPSRCELWTAHEVLASPRRDAAGASTLERRGGGRATGTHGVVGPRGGVGPIPWTVLSAHVLWDAWLHERDVALVADGGLPSTPVEDAVVALYALFIASMPAALRDRDFEVTVALAGRGRHLSASVVPGHVEVREVPVRLDADLRGDLSAVVDSLAGRGAPLAEVIDGDAAKQEPLTWLRAVLAPPT